MRTRRRLSLLVLAVLAVAPVRMHAQERELHWRAIAVEARVDSTGRLHVRERQSMVFTGDWNGGERRFDVGLGHDFRFERMLRVDAATGAEREMARSDLLQVDQWDWATNRTLRWRSRSPSDPPFAGDEITYVLEYSYGNILVPAGDDYVLAHDFAFADRAGDIGRFDLTLTVDPAWRTPPGFTGQYHATALPPGDGFVVTVPLQYQRVGRPSAVRFGAPAAVRLGLAATLLVALVALGRRLVRRERALGRFAPLEPLAAIDERWLETHVFVHRPEVVGAAWDDTTSAPEVAAVLGRMVAEGKLKSRVESEGRGLFRTDNLYLELLVDRRDLSGYEQELVHALFDHDAVVTSTAHVRRRYEKSGFDPASMLSAPLARLVQAAAGAGARETKPPKRPTLLLLLAAVVLLVAGIASRPEDALVALAGAAIGVGAYVLSVSQAVPWRSRVARLPAHALRFVVPLALATWALLLVLVRGDPRVGALVLGGLATFALALWNSTLNLASSRAGAAHIALRRQLAVARAWFMQELRRAEPRLRDAWFPYLLAFGLGRHVDKWFRAFGGEATHRVSARHHADSTHVASGTSNGGGGWTGFGGGGGFAGGGSSGAWAAAAGAMAAGVSAPSSGGSGGGGGGSSGGGSSGGGGGGGW